MSEYQYMLIFTLGPVQSLIAQARKTRDLWIGSFLLSRLMEAAMLGIDENAFVFPGKRTIHGNIPDLPNKYVALFASREDAEKAACLSEMQIAARWYTICDEVRVALLKNHFLPEVQRIWERQISVRQFFEIYWVVVPGSEEHYGDWLKKATRALDARKRLRDFLPQDEPGEKSTISGEREVLHGKGTTRGEARKFWSDLTSQQSIKDIKHDGVERLDAIDSVKRFAVLYSPTLRKNVEEKQEGSVAPDQNKDIGDIGYPSTSSIATARFVEKLLRTPGIDEQLADWKRLTDGDLAQEKPRALPRLAELAGARAWILERDGDFFFEEAFTPRYLKENYRVTMQPAEMEMEKNLTRKPPAFTKDCLNALKKVYQAAGTRPTPYYALVQMDGDNMGNTLSAVSGRTQHSEMSAALSTFARKQVPPIVQGTQSEQFTDAGADGVPAVPIVQGTHPGRLIYAGGDDVLAFTPLAGMLEMVDSLRKQYVKTVQPHAPEKKRDGITASMGIAIAHHFTPLSVVRRAAADAEHLAKHRYGRNAFVVTLLRRSGEQTRVGCQWTYKSLSFEPMQLFQAFYQYFLEDVFSPKCVHILLDEAAALVDLPRAAQEAEVRRVLMRQLDDRQSHKLLGKTDAHLTVEERNRAIKGEIAGLARQIVALAATMEQYIAEKARNAPKDSPLRTSLELHDDTENTLRRGLVETLGWLLVMAFLAREGWEA